MKVFASTPPRRVLARVLRWWRIVVHAAVACVVIAVMCQNASHPSPVRPAEGTSSVPHLRPLP